MDNPCDTCLRWSECNGVDKEYCPLCPGEHNKEEHNMKQYIGTKMIQAAPALRLDDGKGNIRVELLKNNPMPQPGDAVDMGYKVIYEDGYESWSPQDVFEKAYRQTDGMSFGLAIEAMKVGKAAARKGWNGKEMFVYYVPANAYAATTDVAHNYFGKVVPYGAYLAMKTMDGNVVPWLASQTDMLADDWMIVG